MHALCTVVVKHRDDIDRLLDAHAPGIDGELEDEYWWDYAIIGGRFSGLIPIKRNSKILWLPDCNNTPHQGYTDAQWVSLARIRSVDFNIVEQQQQNHELDILNPYAFVLYDENPDCIYCKNDTDWDISILREYVTEHPTYFVCAVDFHF